MLIEQFIASFDAPPEELILDFDATDDRVHGSQEGREFHGYYDAYCFLPLYVFCGDQLLVSYLRPSRIDGAKHAWAILALLVKRLRQSWPKVRIIMRADSGFCRHRILRWCERRGVGYIVGLARNKRLQRLVEEDFAHVEQRFNETGEKQRQFLDLRYGAKSWRCRRAVIAKLEITAKGRNPRFIVTISMVMPKPFTIGSTAPAVIWKTGSRSSSWDCLLIAPARITGGPTSFACCCRVWLMC